MTEKMRRKAKNMRTVQNLIIGGGVIGLSLAWELAQRGRKVTLLEAAQIGKGASWAGAGILPPAARQGVSDPYEQLRSLSHAAHPDWAERLKFQTGIDTGFRRCGGVYLATTSAEEATLAANRWWWQEHAIDHQQWTIDELHRREPSLFATEHSGPSQAKIRSVWFLPDECQLRNPRHLQALAAACCQNSVELVENSPVLAMEPEANSSIRVITQEGTYQADQVCICSGAWAQRTLSQLGIATGIMPVRGQMVLYRCNQPMLNSVINEGHRYLVARRDGRLLAGSVEEEVGYVIETTDEAIAGIRQWAEGILPVLKSQTVERTWAGLRPGSFDGLPYLGNVPRINNLFLAAGHFRSGLHLSCATAVVMANLMQELPNPIDMQPFRIGRG